jgi:hypothetical protein
MSAYYSSVKDPVWADEAQTMINCTVQFNEKIFPHLLSPVLFTAHENDLAPYGPEILAECKAGKYGPIGAFVPPPKPKTNTATTTTGVNLL